MANCKPMFEGAPSDLGAAAGWALVGLGPNQCLVANLLNAATLSHQPRIFFLIF
jgi:hypothetical protein